MNSKNLKNVKSKVTVVTILSLLLASLIPLNGVMASEAEIVPDPEPIQIEEIMESIEIEPMMAEESDLDGITVSPNNPEDETAKDSTPDPSVSGNEVSGNEVSENETPENETTGSEETPSENETPANPSPKKVVRYYSQPEWYTNSGYDAVTAYITDNDDSSNYIQRCFFITDGTDWLLYDYGELASAEFFSKTEHKNGMYVPIQKAKSRKDNSKTNGIDESKIPTLTKKAWDELVCDWRALADVPFTRDSAGRIAYAGEMADDSGDEPDNPTPAPTPSGDLKNYTVTINNNVYKICVTESVSYCGKKHVLKTAKATKSQKPDIEVMVYRNEQIVSAKDYTVKFYNNTNVNGYGKSSAVPYLTINLKKGADKKLLASNGFRFDILPIDIGTLPLSVKKIRYTASTGKLTLNSPVVKIDGTTCKLAPRGAKNRLTGSYVAGYRDGKVIVYGVNNYAGSKEIDLASSKTIDWSF